ncbi:hypothetical protein C7W88_19030 (plasmid) [Novosphingobium sp. THN1]|nr:hypothetical protein C7W88_19030 [Novosphingobium sp. THN1]
MFRMKLWPSPIRDWRIFRKPCLSIRQVVSATRAIDIDLIVVAIGSVIRPVLWFGRKGTADL